MDKDNPPLTRAGAPVRERLQPYVSGVVVVAAASAIAYGLDKILPLPNLSLVFLLAVLFLGMRYGALPAICAGLLSCAVYNFLFLEPYYTFLVDHEDDTLTLAFFLVVAGLTGNLAGSVRRKLVDAQQSAQRTAILYEFSRKVAAATTLDAMIAAVQNHVAATLGASATVILPTPQDGETLPEACLPQEDRAAAAYAWRHLLPSGCAARACFEARRLFMPLTTAHGRVGLLAIAYLDGRKALTSEQEDLLRAVADQAAVALERTQLAAEAERLRWLSETESLRAALLSSISHDLRTPLVSVIGSATTLSTVGKLISDDERADLVATILAEAKRLNRFVQNLLDMTRLSYGGLKPRRDWVDVRDIVGHAVAAMRDTLAPFAVAMATDDAVPLLFADPVLIEHALVNILDNAAKYSPPGGRIAIRIGCAGNAVVIRIADQGPGISAPDRERVFDMFMRVRHRDSRQPGTGLGLAICRGFVTAHGGTVAIEAGDGGNGAAVVVTLPVTEAPPPDPTEGDPT
jgi:two-component system, OmpR family, sensor histidine kinase KdpD